MRDDSVTHHSHRFRIEDTKTRKCIAECVWAKNCFQKTVNVQTIPTNEMSVYYNDTCVGKLSKLGKGELRDAGFRATFYTKQFQIDVTCIHNGGEWLKLTATKSC